jgi:undecaprenyl-diphosphatase
MPYNPLTQKIASLERYIARLAIVSKIGKKYPKTSKFISDRFSPTSFTGLTLTILIILLVGATAILSDLAEDMANAESIVKIDQSFSQFLFSNRSLPVSKTLYVITQAAGFYASLIVPAVFSVYMWLKKRRAYAITMWIVLIGIGASIHFGKALFHRARPIGIGYYIEKNFSFPSGHSTTAMGMYGFIIYCLMREEHKRSARIITFIFGILLITTIGFSRIYLGVHYLSDVLGGFLVGFIWVIFGISLVEWNKYRKLVHHKEINPGQ